MTSGPKVDVRDLKSVRRAAQSPDVVLGEDWIGLDGVTDHLPDKPIKRRGILSLRKSPIARKIITFNLIAMTLMIAGLLYLSSSRNSLTYQRATALISEAELIANVLEVQLPDRAPVNLATADGIDPAAALAGLTLSGGVQVSVFAPDASLVARVNDALTESEIADLQAQIGRTVIIDFLGAIGGGVTGLFQKEPDQSHEQLFAELSVDVVERAMRDGAQLDVYDIGGSTIFTVTTPIMQNDTPVGVVTVATASGEVDALVRRAREDVMQLFVVGLAVSIGLSLVLASTVANPLADLAQAAEASHQKNARKMSPVKVRIPDLTGRPDEIGRLSGALRGMVAALSERIESNEQFAADVAHEIKNPLASLRSAVGSLRGARRDDQRDQLLAIIEHDVRRLDRLVTDISNASRLDSELVKEVEETFDLNTTLRNILDHLGKDAERRGIEFITDVPDLPLMIQGLEGRLAQVFVNLITNAVSFCDDGDAIRVWSRTRENRVLVVVEDTGPGIPDGALKKIFQRFYSERPKRQFGNNSGLGLAISKQIVEAHGGVIWAENIRPTEADPTSEPSGARFVVGLPI
ncbi:MAG: sensor histidine kinase [Loktanella sp.]|nr:sensor histidine kinase [Loktanella sp.]